LKKFIIISIICSIGLTGCTSDTVEVDMSEDKYEESVIFEQDQSLLSEAELITLVNKWHKDLFASTNLRLMPILLNAYLVDPVLDEIIDQQKFGNNFNAETVQLLGDWSENAIAHTQLLEDFKSEPGKDPWGVSEGIPTFKKLLPSEMLAMSKFSSKYTGKCGSIANSLYAIMRKMGMKSEDGVIARLGNHTIGLFKVEDKIYVIDNNYVGELSEKFIEKVSRYRYYGFYNDQVSFKGSFKITLEMLKSSNSIIEEIITGNSIKEEDLFRMNMNSDYIDFATQSMNVDDQSIYVEASSIGPVVTELSSQLEDFESITNWVENNITTQHILKIDNSIQTADQTIVFSSGDESDKGLLILSIMKIKDIKGELVKSDAGSYIVRRKEIYSISESNLVSEIKGKIIYELKQ